MVEPALALGDQMNDSNSVRPIMTRTRGGFGEVIVSKAASAKPPAGTRYTKVSQKMLDMVRDPSEA